ncbi:MAG: GNAT family N-acetyltransferase [Desulfurococcales archaeon]|nr:GNAT family N-acetyltransferase [Desulfurococcales archaeon]MCE4626308.1 GNAT family N-acetyltransferase [Desulfurococcales archaeon]MCE4628715.1 GNAT family N-acetyltransferase [Desulfurococcales archaeon]
MYEPALSVRKPVESDLEALANLIKRFYLFNEEFDPAWAVTDNLDQAAMERAKAYIEGDGITLVAVCDDEPVGYLHVEIRDNPMLSTRKLGIITELYVIPAKRGRGIASKLVEEAQKELSSLGIAHIAAEFPSQNFVAQSFYTKLKFRSYSSIYLREV